MKPKCFIYAYKNVVYYFSVDKNTMEWLIIEQDKSLYRIDFDKRIGLAHTFRKPISYIEIHPNIYALVSSIGKKMFSFLRRLTPINNPITFNYYTGYFKESMAINSFDEDSFSITFNAKKIADESINLSYNKSRFVEKIVKTISSLHRLSIHQYVQMKLKQ